LLKHLETPGLEINFLFRNVRDDVIGATRREQQPFVYGSLSKETIYLKPALPPPPVAAPRPPDEVTWAFLKDTRDEMALKRFIQEFPKSPLRIQADERIAALASEAERAKALEAERAKALEIERAKALEAERMKTAAIPQSDPREVTRSLQLELKRVGCFDGTINGEFGSSTRAALRNFAKLASVSLPENEPSLDALKAVRGVDKRICPLVCPTGERAEGDRCIRIVCPSGQILKDGTCVARPVADAQRRATPPPEPPPATSSSKCFTFQGRRFCE
jgi:hypothetical protein